MDNPQHQTLKLSKHTDPQHHYRAFLYGIAALLLMVSATGAGYLFATKESSEAAHQTTPIAQRIPTPTSIQTLNTSLTPIPTNHPMPVSVKVSTDGSYVATWLKVGNGTTITIYTRDGHIITYDVIRANSKALGYDVKFKCPCDARVKEWIDNTHFYLTISNEHEEEYQYLVNAKTGFVDESSFMRIK